MSDAVYYEKPVALDRGKHRKLGKQRGGYEQRALRIEG